MVEQGMPSGGSAKAIVWSIMEKMFVDLCIGEENSQEKKG